MATTVANGTSEAPEFLFHVKRTIIDYAEDKSGATQTTDILGTFTELTAAKNAALAGLASEGYVKDDFEVYEENDGNSSWKYGDGVLAYAKAPAGQVFVVSVDTNPNVSHFKGNASGEVEGHLHYVIQQTINYNKDPTGASQMTEVEGTYLTRDAARKAARLALLDQNVTKKDFAEYDEFDDARDVNEWPYGDTVLVHAAAETGENFNVAVKTQPHAHQHHACKHHAGGKCLCKCTHSENQCRTQTCKHAECDCK